MKFIKNIAKMVIPGYALADILVKNDSIVNSIFPIANIISSPHEIIKGTLLKSFFEKKVEPEVGSIVLCKIAANFAEHSGIYIGDGKFVELAGSGKIRKVKKNKFLSGGMTRTGFEIYVACDSNDNCISSNKVAKRAKKKLGESRDYNFIIDNCHQFTAGCITGHFEKPVNFFWWLSDIIKIKLNNGECIRWNVCDI